MSLSSRLWDAAAGRGEGGTGFSLCENPCNCPFFSAPAKAGCHPDRHPMDTSHENYVALGTLACKRRDFRFADRCPTSQRFAHLSSITRDRRLVLRPVLATLQVPIRVLQMANPPCDTEPQSPSHRGTLSDCTTTSRRTCSRKSSSLNPLRIGELSLTLRPPARKPLQRPGNRLNPLRIGELSLTLALATPSVPVSYSLHFHHLKIKLLFFAVIRRTVV